MSDDSPRLAILIDADNTSPRVAEGLFLEIAKLGEASVRRIYGDFSDDRLKGWSRILAKHAIIPHQQFAYTTGKNSSDIALVIDAMDLLHSGRFDGFCLVSSDSDFTRLASRIREQGVAVYGFGQRKTPEAFRQACRRFIFTENLLTDTGSNAGSGAASDAETETDAAPRREPPAAAVPLIRSAMDDIGDDEDGWIALGSVGQRLSNLAPDFDSRTYGSSKLSGLIERSGAFEIERREGRPIRIRMKPEGGGKTEVAKPAQAAEEKPAPASRRRSSSRAAEKSDEKSSEKPAVAETEAKPKPKSRSSRRKTAKDDG